MTITNTLSLLVLYLAVSLFLMPRGKRTEQLLTLLWPVVVTLLLVLVVITGTFFVPYKVWESLRVRRIINNLWMNNDNR